jgi:RNA polymerase sigma-70 factor (ECF subfamily)
MEPTGRVDELRIREFLAGEYPRVVAAVRLVAGDGEAAEDAVAEALARAWERSDRGESIASLPAWVTRVAMNLALSRWRRLRADAQVRHRITDVASDPADVDDRLDVERALARLSRREREATVLRYFLGFDVAETATVLGVSDGTVKTLLFRARKELAEVLGERTPEEMGDHADLR